MKHLFAVMTCNQPAHVFKACAQRDTWVKEVRKFAVVEFFVGQGDYITPDVIQQPVGDYYADIPAKVREICRYAVQHGYDYVTKVDDDVYIAPVRARQLPVAPYHYVGTFCPPTGGFPAHYASGFCYHLSREAASVIATAELNHDWMDERFVANTLARVGICGHHDPDNYVAMNLPPSLLPPLCRETGTVFAEYSGEGIFQMHAAFHNAR